MDIIIKTDIIREFMKKNNLTKKQFCKECDISICSLNNVLKQNTKISSLVFIKMAIRMKIRLDDFVK